VDLLPIELGELRDGGADLKLLGFTDKELAEYLKEFDTNLEDGQGRDVKEWRQKPAHPDNHWLDCLVGCAAAANMVGVKAAGQALPQRPRKRMLTQADFDRR
jgi:hypothetical protein